MDKYIVTNFSYGTGPYLRTTELAIAFNDELEKLGMKRLGIIVPLVYGEKQKNIMLEEFSSYLEEIFLDEKLGTMLANVFYGNSDYQDALLKWVESAKESSKNAHKHLRGEFTVKSLSGKNKIIQGNDIIVEINRSPRIRYDVAPSYFTTFAYIEDILTNMKNLTIEKMPSQQLIDEGIGLAKWIESNYRIHAVAYPATFSWKDNYIKKYKTELITPPISRIYRKNYNNLEPGIFVTITGIPGLERLFKDAMRLGLKLYSNDIKVVPDSIKVLPHVIPNQNIVFQFARSGWSSVWLSMISATPLVVPEFDISDDPEIYFNNIAIEKLGIGIIYRGQKLEEILNKSEEIKKNSLTICNKIIDRWGTLDGNKYCAELFVKDFLKNN